MKKTKISCLAGGILLLFLILLATLRETEPIGRYVRIPVFCYHDILPEDKIPKDKRGEADPWTISVEDFEKDLLYLLRRGYTPISTKDYVSNSYKGGKIPEKAFIVTIDDGNKSNLLYALPVIEKYKVPATFCLIGDIIQLKEDEEALKNPYAKFMTEEEIRELAQSPLTEFASHSNKMHHQLIESNDFERQGIIKKEEETLEEYREALLNDIVPFKTRIEDLTGKDCIAFTFPFGQVDVQSLPILKEAGFKINYALRNSMIYYHGFEGEIQNQPRFIRKNNYSTKKFLCDLAGIK